MSTYDKPLPRVTEEAKPFWEACRQHKLIIQQCKDCGHVQFYPSALCNDCWSSNLEWLETAGKGVIYSFTVVHRAPLPGFRPNVPYIIAIIDLDEGVRLMSNLIRCKPEDANIGMPVVVEFDDVTEQISLPKFRPAEDRRNTA